MTKHNIEAQWQEVDRLLATIETADPRWRFMISKVRKAVLALASELHQRDIEKQNNQLKMLQVQAENLRLTRQVNDLKAKVGYQEAAIAAAKQLTRASFANLAILGEK